MKNVLFFTLLLCVFTTAIQAQNTQRLNQENYPNFLTPESPVSAEQSSKWLHNQFNLQEEVKLETVRDVVDHLNHRHIRHQQYYKGVIVEGGVYTTHSQKGNVTLASGRLIDVSQVNTKPVLTADQAELKAWTVVPSDATRSEFLHDHHHGAGDHHHDGDLVIIDPPYSRTGPSLAYKYDVYTSEPLYRAYVYVDAHNGEVIWEHERIHDTNQPATGDSEYNGNVSFTADLSGNYRLRQTLDDDGVETYDMNNGTNYGAATDVTSATSNFTGEETAVQAHWGAEQTHDYYLSEHNRHSYDDQGSKLLSYVSYATNYANAFWDGSRMTYGDGDGVNYGPLVSLDIVGHELTHGVVEYSAALIYQNQSGALNESFADIFGECIEHHASGSNDWLLGEQIGVGGSGGAFRSMANPNLYGDPDTYLGDYWYSGIGDNGGVHINSGVQNKWFYILVNGESGTNDLGNTYDVTGLGMSKAEDIAYRNLTVYLTNNSQYSDARQGAIQAAKDLYGPGSAEEIAVTNAWYAVGVGGEYGTISYCPSQGNNATYEWIAGVTIGSFTNNSAGASYTDFLDQTIDLTTGNSYPVALVPGFRSSSYDEYWKIWIDFDQNGDFGDAGELVYDAGSAVSTTVTGTISVPLSALEGTTRMRVSMKYNAGQTPCETFTYGEVEDYTANIISGGSGDVTAPTAPGNISATNITSSSADLNWSASTDDIGVVNYDIYLDGTQVGSTASLNYNLINLNASTNYLVEVYAKDAAGNLSAPGNTNFTTLIATDVTAPSAPGNLSASNITINSADVNWTASTDNVGVTGYDVYLDGILNGSTTATSYSFTGLTASTSYVVEVVAYDAAGNESTPSSITFTTEADNTGGSNDLLSGDYFESGWDGWTDGGSDCYRYNGSRSYEGIRSIRLRDNSGTPSAMTKGGYDLTPYNSVEVEFHFYPNSMETGEDFWLMYNDGNGWQTVATYARGTDFNNGSFYSSTVVISDADYNLSANAEFRFQCDASANADQVYIDAVTITGINNTTILAAQSGKSLERLHTPIDISSTEDYDLLIAPNPTSGITTILSEDEVKLAIIHNMHGQLISTVHNPTTINLSEYPAGIYFIEIITAEETNIERVLKQ